jgi:hypothetical protein
MNRTGRYSLSIAFSAGLLLLYWHAASLDQLPVSGLLTSFNIPGITADARTVFSVPHVSDQNQFREASGHVAMLGSMAFIGNGAGDDLKALEGFDTRQLSGPVFNIRDYGALGNGSHDDTKAIQAAVNAALLQHGTVYFPKPPNFYRVTNTIDVIPASGDQAPINFKGEGSWNMIEFYSRKGRACFNIRGIKRAIFEGVHILCKYDDQIAWSIVY